MRKTVIFVLVILCLAACTRYHQIQIQFPNGNSINALVADSYKKQEFAWQQQRAPFQTGVLFVFTREEEQAYYRKNTLLDLDVVFLDNNQRITAMHTNVPHREKYTIDAEIPFAFATAKYLLELPAGTINKQQLSVGKTLLFSLPS